MEYIVGRYSDPFPRMDMDKLNEQYLSYHVMTPKEIPAFVKERTCLDTEDSYHVDQLWNYLKGVKKQGTNESI